jgi:hypothetical protein
MTNLFWGKNGQRRNFAPRKRAGMQVGRSETSPGTDAGLNFLIPRRLQKSYNWAWPGADTVKTDIQTHPRREVPLHAY